MTLANMIATDEQALICDLAETYRIYNYRSLPAMLAATFCVGLRDDSRIKMKMAGFRISQKMSMIGMIADSLNLLIWIISGGKTAGHPAPPSILEAVYGTDSRQNSDMTSFDSAADFEAARQKIMKKGGG